MNNLEAHKTIARTHEPLLDFQNVDGNEYMAQEGDGAATAAAEDELRERAELDAQLALVEQQELKACAGKADNIRSHH
jgi:hypothetical protein